MGGLLQSLVVATPSRQGQIYLRSVYNDIHTVEESNPRLKYYTKLRMSEHTLADLTWWKKFLTENPGNRSPSGSLGSMTVTWGDGSGTGTGGTVETVKPGLPKIDTWMGTWVPIVSHFDSNWRELRTLLWTVERLAKGDLEKLLGGTMFYFTDNLVTYYVVQNGSSSSPELHQLVRNLKGLKVEIQCRIEVVHVPGKLMIAAGPDGLSRGVWLSPDRMLRSTVEESRISLEAVPLCKALEEWLLKLVGRDTATKYTRHTSTSDWRWDDIIGQLLLFWNPTPEIAHQAISQFLDSWVERACETEGIFIIPRILQQEWGFQSACL
jgi:hypothetical protein